MSDPNPAQPSAPIVEPEDIMYPSAIPFVLVHLACFAALWTGVTYQAVCLCLLFYWLRIFAIGAGYHRYFAQRAYRTSRAFQFLLAVLSQSSRLRPLWLPPPPCHSRSSPCSSIAARRPNLVARARRRSLGSLSFRPASSTTATSITATCWPPSSFWARTFSPRKRGSGSRSPVSSAPTITVSLCRVRMSNLSAEDEEKPLDPAAARIVAKVRWLMLISGATTALAVAAVLGVIGYRVFKSEGSAATPADVLAQLPKGARIVATAVAEDRIVVTVDAGGAIEIRTFDLRTLRPTGRLRFTTEP